MVSHFLNHAIVVTEERFTILILSERFSETYALFKLFHFVPYLRSHITYYTLHAKSSFFFFYRHTVLGLDM
jgi:hypothetical protein